MRQLKTHKLRSTTKPEDKVVTGLNFEECLNEVARKNNYSDWMQLSYSIFCKWAYSKGEVMLSTRKLLNKYIHETMELYRSQPSDQLSEHAVSDEEILKQFPSSKHDAENKAMYNRRKGAKWMRSKLFLSSDHKNKNESKK